MNGVSGKDGVIGDEDLLVLQVILVNSVFEPLQAVPVSFIPVFQKMVDSPDEREVKDVSSSFLVFLECKICFDFFQEQVSNSGQ